MIEVNIDKSYKDDAEVSINDTDYLGVKARIVVELVSRWGIVAAIPDGEDSAGRQRLRMMTPGELVDRSMDIADKMFGELELRDWMIQLPSNEARDIAVQNIIEEQENNERMNNH